MVQGHRAQLKNNFTRLEGVIPFDFFFPLLVLICFLKPQVLISLVCFYVVVFLSLSGVWKLFQLLIIHSMVSIVNTIHTKCVKCITSCLLFGSICESLVKLYCLV